MTTPNPDWTPGSAIASPVSEMVSVDPAALAYPDVYKLLIGAIVPRPIALVSTISRDGIGNLAPFSFFNGVCSNPPALMISVSPKADGSPKDTLVNIEQTGQFVVNCANLWFAEALVSCGTVFPHGVNELEKAGLTPLPSEKVKPVRVKESAMQMECELLQKVAVGEGPGSSVLIIGKILLFHFARQIYQNGRINYGDLLPFSRLGGISYASVKETFNMPVPPPNPKAS